MRPVRLVLWRHGQTVWNAERRFQGQSDIPLDETGQAQAERAARLLAALRPDLIVSSDLSRAAGTAAALGRLTGLEVTLDKDLRERSGGSWEGLTDTEIRTRYPVEHASWTPPDGEPSAVVAERVAGALHRAAEAVSGPGTPTGLAVVASHGAALRLGMSRLLGMPDGTVRRARPAVQLLLVGPRPPERPLAAGRAQRRYAARARRAQ